MRTDVNTSHSPIVTWSAGLSRDGCEASAQAGTPFFHDVLTRVTWWVIYRPVSSAAVWKKAKNTVLPHSAPLRACPVRLRSGQALSAVEWGKLRRKRRFV